MRLAQRLDRIGRPPTDDEWTVISQRRPADGEWLLVVTSTGIACQPGCPARTPGRDRVRIVERLADAVAAGARPCLRCRPDVSRASSNRRTGADGRDPVASAIGRLEAALVAGEPVPDDRDLAAGVGLSERRLREAFRSTLGVTPRGWLAGRRADRLRSQLAGGSDVLNAVLDAGYSAPSAAYEAADGQLGMAPGRYRDGAPGEQIGWTVTPIPDGLAMVAATERGLCAIRLGGDAEALERDLRDEFPRASLARDDAGLAEAARIVSDLASGRRRPEADSLPLDVHATAFRRRVWEALRGIPWGETRSYGEIARQVGAPGAARAVGAACGANPIPIVVPCHRVIAADGSLHGYAYGLGRKRQLLDAERAAAGDGVARVATSDAVLGASAPARGDEVAVG